MDLELCARYAPYVLFDKQEPFYPVRVGVTVLKREGPSPSFPRTFSFQNPDLKQIIEYAIYWDYDIQHLYELEHVWVYVGRQGEVVDCEASFHGKYLKGLLKDRGNLVDDTHVRLYSQPGKHAFSPVAAFFELVPNLMTATREEAGADGLTVPNMLKDRVATSEETNLLVKRYLQTFAFTPSLEYAEYRFSKELFIPWPELLEEIPRRISRELAAIRKFAANGMSG